MRREDVIAAPVGLGNGRVHREAGEEVARRMLCKGRADRHHREQRVIVGVAEGRTRRRDQRPARHLFIDTRAAEIDGIGAVARGIAGEARGHPQQLVERDRAARIVRMLPVGDRGRGSDIRIAAMHCGADDGRGNALGHRPCALRRIDAEPGGIAFGDDRPFAQHHHGSRVRICAEPARERARDRATLKLRHNPGGVAVGIDTRGPRLGIVGWGMRLQRHHVPHRPHGGSGDLIQGGRGQPMLSPDTHRMERTAHLLVRSGHTRRHAFVPAHADCKFAHLRHHIAHQRVELGIHTDQLVCPHARLAALGAVGARIKDRAACRQSDITGGEAALLGGRRGHGLGGERGGSDGNGRGNQGFEMHHRRLARSRPGVKRSAHAKGAGCLSHPAPEILADGMAYAASISSSFMTGPESWPLASTSRSTNSMIAMAAASEARKPALSTRV